MQFELKEKKDWRKIMQFDLRPNFDFFAIFRTMRVAYPAACNKYVML